MTVKTSEAAKPTAAPTTQNALAPDPNGQPGKPIPTSRTRPPQVISHPNDVAALIMAQMNTVSAKKDELTIAIKQLTDTTQQLVRAYAEHTNLIQQLNRKVAELEAEKPKAAGNTSGTH